MDGIRIERAVEGERVELRQGLAALVRGEHVTVQQGGAAMILADDDVRVERGGARTMIAGESLSVNQGGAGMILAGGDVRIVQGGSGTLIALGGASIEQGGAMALITTRARLSGRSFVGIALARRIDLHEGSRVLAGPREAGLIAAVGGLLALVLLLRR